MKLHNLQLGELCACDYGLIVLPILKSFMKVYSEISQSSQQFFPFLLDVFCYVFPY